MIPPLVLASRSPRRRELLVAAGAKDVKIAASDVEESADASIGLAALVLHNARVKATDIAAQFPRSIVLGADTLVWLDGTALGKPSDMGEARQMLERLSGRVHEVCTGVHLVRLEPHLQIEFHETTRVRFRPLDAAAIDAYLDKVDVLDKAGAYALQEHGDLIIESVEGSRSNVVGLPVERTLAALRRFTPQA
ncbi:MAG: Maf family protein [Chthoniobacterales bacterium]